MCIVDCFLVDSSGPPSAKALFLHGARLPLFLLFNLGRLADLVLLGIRWLSGLPKA